MARPRVEIDWENFDKLCVMQATQEEIASFFGCSVDTIERAVKRKWSQGFAEYFAQKAGKGRVSLRRKQFEMAVSGDRTMLIWLGKQYLKQTDKVEAKNELTGKDGTPLGRLSDDEVERRYQELIAKGKA